MLQNILQTHVKIYRCTEVKYITVNLETNAFIYYCESPTFNDNARSINAIS